MKFPYVNYGEYSMPIIPVTLSIGDHCIVTEALIDSGAASCIFDVQFAHALGISTIESGQKIIFEGVSGHRLIGYSHTITIEVGGHRLGDIDVSFSSDMPDNATNILGQQGFFQICPIKFTYRIREIDVMTGSMHQ
jgi:hypothetical protein